MPKPFIPPMKGNKTPFTPGTPAKSSQKPAVTQPRPVSRRPAGRGG